MVWRTKKSTKTPTLLYQIKGEERGQLQALSAIAQMAEASSQVLLKKVIERENMPAEAVYDPTTMAFYQK